MRAAGLILLLALAALFALDGCDGDGLVLDKVKITGTDNGGGGGVEPTPTPIPDSATGLGTWIASYGDDQLESGTGGGLQQYAALVRITKNGTSLSGTGTVYRLFSSTPFNERIGIQFTGDISGNDATMSVASATTTSVTDAPVWRLRFSGTRMVGMYVGLNLSGNVTRSGHALWHYVQSGTIDGTWAAGYSDAFGTTAFPARDRTADALFDQVSGTSSLSGTGNFIEQRDGDVPFTIGYNVLNGNLPASSEATFTMGELGVGANEIDWFGFNSKNVFAGAYQQFNTAGALARYGRAMWYYSDTQPVPDDVDAVWVTSFSDSTGSDRRDYVMTASLQAGENNSVTGSGSLVDQMGSVTTYMNASIANATITGSHLQMDLVAATGDRFAWDLRLAGNLLVGSYQHTNGLGYFISRGSAEWRPQQTFSLVGTWAASYFDTVAVTQPNSQMALVTISSQDGGGNLAGFGALRLGNGEQNRRLFDLADSFVSNGDIVWVWRGADLFGDTVWRLRQAGDTLVGTYVNKNSAGSLETRGSALWVRTSTSSSL